MSAQVSTEAFLNAKVTLLEEDNRVKTDKLALLEAYVQQQNETIRSLTETTGDTDVEDD